MVELGKHEDFDKAGFDEAKQGRVCLDLQGISCPTNFVKAKMFLSKLPLGQTAEIILDDGEPMDNVPASLELEGYEILAEAMDPGGKTWRVIIKK